MIKTSWRIEVRDLLLITLIASQSGLCKPTQANRNIDESSTVPAILFTTIAKKFNWKFNRIPTVTFNCSEISKFTSLKVL